MATNIDKRLLFLIMALYKKTLLQVRCTPQGHLTNVIPTQRGVRQGCILAPLLFNYYINSLVGQLTNVDYHPPKIAHRHLAVLLYADDAAILSRTPIGLRRALQKLETCCREEHLEINYDKTKIMAFGRRTKIYTWKINEHRIEQVLQYKYLGVVFQANNSRKAHGDYVSLNAQRSSSAIIQYSKSRGGNSFPAALKLFQAKVMSQMLYGSQLGLYPNVKSLECIQTKFLRAMLGVPKDVSNVRIRLETGQIRVEARIWMNIFTYWLRLLFHPEGLVSLILHDGNHSGWMGTIHKKLISLGLSIEELIPMGLEQVKSIIKQRITDIERQNDLAKVSDFNIREDIRFFAPALYLSYLDIFNHRRAFSLARFQVLPSAVTEGRYKKIPYLERLCPCGLGEIETTEHVLLRCTFYQTSRSKFILPLLCKFPGRTDSQFTYLLLADGNLSHVHNVAKFFAAAISIRKFIMKSLD